jgi:hypothetical protein
VHIDICTFATQKLLTRRFYKVRKWTFVIYWTILRLFKIIVLLEIGVLQLMEEITWKRNENETIGEPHYLPLLVVCKNDNRNYSAILATLQSSENGRVVTIARMRNKVYKVVVFVFLVLNSVASSDKVDPDVFRNIVRATL